LVPRLTSTIFPQLPRRAMPMFRGALVAGIAVTLVLGSLRLFPVALVVAALLVPLLVLLYLYDVDVYQDAPLSVVALTMVAGAAGGVATGRLAEAVSPAGAAFLVEQGSRNALLRGLLIPLLGTAVMLVGPLLLIFFRRFEDILDGATFGAASAVAFVGAQVLTQSGSVIGGELRPAGVRSAWLPRIAELAVAAPVLSAAAIGAAAGAIWLRYRAPLAHRRTQGAAAQPLVVVTAAALLIAGAALGQLFFDGLASLAIVAALAVVGLLWLRTILHVGLLEEAFELDPGRDIACANCGAKTPRHGFCLHCGISQRALPKRQEDGRAGTPRPTGDSPRYRTGAAPARLRTAAFSALFATMLAAGAGAGVAAARASGFVGGGRTCSESAPCASPSSAPRRTQGVTWRSRLGVSFEYDELLWKVVSKEPDEVRLRLGGQGWLVAVARRVPDASDLLDGLVSGLRGEMSDLVPNGPHRRILGPNIGYTPGVGAAYCGTIFNAQGGHVRVDVLVMAASSGGVSAAVAVVSDDCDKWPIQSRPRMLSEADSLVNTFSWASVRG
jgi:hypothetical protein